MTETRPPLEDPAYQPANVPTGDGDVPSVIERWGPRSQRRWFRRFYGQLRPRPAVYWERFYCDSEDHRGLCCPSCTYWDDEYGQDNIGAEYGKCCCYALRSTDD